MRISRTRLADGLLTSHARRPNGGWLSLEAALGGGEQPALRFSGFFYGVVGPSGHALALTR
jgi:hypothetical protein